MTSYRNRPEDDERHDEHDEHGEGDDQADDDAEQLVVSRRRFVAVARDCDDDKAKPKLT